MQKNDWKKKEWIVISAVVILMAVAGILLFAYLRFDAAEYTQAMLDVTYKNQTENYMKLSGVSQKEAEGIFQKNINATMAEFQNLKLPEELEKNYRSLFKDIVKQVKYTVNSSEKTDNKNYAVNLTVEPMLLFDDTYEEFQLKAKEYAKGITDSVMKGAKMPTEEEIQNRVYQMYYEILREELNAKVVYGKPQKLTVHVKRVGDHTYEIEEKDIKRLNEKLISREKLSRNS